MDLFVLLKHLDSLKHLKRTGWLQFDVPDPETVAAHTYRMAMLTMVIEDASLDRMKCLRMALVHDLAEAIVGDITPRCGVPKSVKQKIEEEAMLEISGLVPELCGKEWLHLWREYEAGETSEAIVVKQLDKFDLMAQAFEYEQKYGIDLEEIFSSARDSFNTQPFMQWSAELCLRRSKWKRQDCSIRGHPVGSAL